MAIPKNNDKSELFCQKKENIIKADVYPLDLSLFLNIPQKPLGLENSFFAPLQEGYDPIMIAEAALAYWNRFVVSGEKILREVFLNAALWLVRQVQYIGDDAAGWPLAYSHSHYFTRGSWLSSIAQGCGLSVLTRAYQLTEDELFLETAHCVVCTFERDILDGGVCTPIGADGVFFEEVAVYPAAHTLQGCIFGLLGLYDYVNITGNSHMQQYIERCEETLYSLFDEFDLGFWTRADLLRDNLATPIQLAQQIALVEALNSYKKCPHYVVRIVRWQRYQQGAFSHLRYTLAYGKVLLLQTLFRCVRTTIMPRLSMSNPQFATRLRVCVPMPNHSLPGGIGTFLDRMARIMVDRWQMEYVTHRIRSDVGERIIHQFGRDSMSPWLFPQVWFYVFVGVRKLLSLMQQGVHYDLIIPQDGVFSGAFAALVGKLTGIRVVCFDHSTLTYKSQTYRIEKQRYLDGREWPWLFHQLVKFLLTFYWPSLHILARFATTQADHLLSPGVFGDEIDEMCHELHIPLSRVTRFNVTVDRQRQTNLTTEERVAKRTSMGIPADALVIAITVRFDLEKGLDISMESISRALLSLPSTLRDRVCVMLAGDGPLRRWLEEEIQRRGLSHICRMMGSISSEDVDSLLDVSDISLHTSTRGVCMPAAVLEGMAAGCAVIASNEPLANVHVLAEERGIVVPAGDVEQTSNALERLLKDSELRDRMGKAAQDYIALHHSAEAFRRILLRMSYWSGLDQLLETQAEPEKSDERSERE